jgi:DNA-binding response OmpR family regulator
MSEQPIHVLLIEANPGDARLLRELVRDVGGSQLELTHADRLAIGLQCREPGTIDAILLDLSLPDSAGMATFRTMQAHAPHVPIIVLSGLNDAAIALQAMYAGAQDYLVKGQSALCDRAAARAGAARSNHPCAG